MLPLDEGDGRFHDPESSLYGAESHLDLEGVSRRAHALEIDRLENLAAKTFETTRQIMDADTETCAGIPRATAGYQTTIPWPVAGTAAGDPSRSEHEVILVCEPQQLRQVRRGMAEIRIHLEDPLVAPVQGFAEAIEVGCAEAEFCTAVRDQYALVTVRQPVCDLAGSVW